MYSSAKDLVIDWTFSKLITTISALLDSMSSKNREAPFLVVKSSER